MSIGGRKIYTVYRATSRIDGSMYIGMTRRPVSKRANAHRFEAHSRKDDMKFHAVMREHGLHSFTFEAIAQCKSLSVPWDLERMVISEHAARGSALLNQRGGQGTDAGSSVGHYDHRIHSFLHNEYGLIFCTQRELITRFSLNPGHVSNVVSGKERSVKGWRVMREGNDRGGLNGSI